MFYRWTTPIQPGDPYNCNNFGARIYDCETLNDKTNISQWSIRQNIQRDLLVATLSAGPVGIGDMVGATDLRMLRPVLNKASIILKPAHPFLRLNRYYMGDTTTSVFTAVGVPARSQSALLDRRANSMSRLTPLNGSKDSQDALWWHMLLSTGNTAGPSLQSVSITELWPTPPPTAAFLATWAFGWPMATPPPASKCVHGARPTACLSLVDAAHPLSIATPKATVETPTQRDTLPFRHLVLAPVLPSGFVLIGELSKFVPVSPQRFLVHDNTSSAVGDDDTASDACRLQEITKNGADLAFSLVGSHGEVVSVIVVAPAPPINSDGVPRSAASRAMAGTVLVVKATIRSSERVDVICAKGACHVVSSAVD